MSMFCIRVFRSHNKSESGIDKSRHTSRKPELRGPTNVHQNSCSILHHRLSDGNKKAAYVKTNPKNCIHRHYKNACNCSWKQRHWHCHIYLPCSPEMRHHRFHKGSLRLLIDYGPSCLPNGSHFRHLLPNTSCFYTGKHSQMIKNTIARGVRRHSAKA